MPSSSGNGNRRRTLIDLSMPEGQFSGPDTSLRQATGVKPSAEAYPAYANVMTFPTDIEAMKYFEKIPHPERFSAFDLELMKLFKQQDLNPNYMSNTLELEMVKKYLSPWLSDMDEKLLRLPSDTQRKLDAATDEAERIVWRHLRDAFLIYFGTPTDPHIVPDNLWVPISFATATDVAQKAITDLRNNLFNPAGTANLEDKLRKIGAFGQERKNFYFWNTPPRYWPEVSFQSRPVIYYDRNKLGTYTNLITLPPQFKALGNHNFEALPEGYVQPLGNGSYDICVEKVFYFVKDVFNFEGPEFLGLWDLDPGENSPNGVPLTPLHNGHFREFKRHGYGRDFIILSKLQEMEGVTPYCWRYNNAQ